MRTALAALTLCTLLRPPLPVQAASFDCAAASSRVERMICADPALSAADNGLGTVFAEAMSVSPHPQAVRAEQRQWIASARDKAATANDLLTAYQHRTNDLRTQIAAWQEIRQSVATTPPDQCLKLGDTDDASCTVTGTGTLAGAPGGRLRYRLQIWRDGEQTIGTGVIVLAGDDAAARAVTWSADREAVFEAPEILQTPQGMFLDLPGHLSGTGNISAESLFVFRDGVWREVDITTWIAQLAGRLPPGIGAWKGIYPDWRAMTAYTPLWREGDGNCCPRGGSATATLRLDRDRIVLVSLRLSSRPLPEQ